MNQIFSLYFIGNPERQNLECELYLHIYVLPKLTRWTPHPFMEDGILRNLSLLCRMKFKDLKNCGPTTITNPRLSCLFDQRSCPIKGYLWALLKHFTFSDPMGNGITTVIREFQSPCWYLRWPCYEFPNEKEWTYIRIEEKGTQINSKSQTSYMQGSPLH